MYMPLVASFTLLPLILKDQSLVSSVNSTVIVANNA